MQEPAFAANAVVQEWTGGIPEEITTGSLHIQSFDGGIYLATWDRPAYLVAIGETDSNDRLVANVDVRFDGNAMDLTVTVEDTSTNPLPVPVSVDVGDAPFAQVKVWVPDLAFHKIVERDHPRPAQSGIHMKTQLKPKDLTQEKAWTKVLNHGLETTSLDVHVINLGVAARTIDADQIRIHSDNGGVDLDGLHGFAEDANYQVSSYNGELCVSDVGTDVLSAKTSNGRVRWDGVRARVADVVSNNGDIWLDNVETQDGELDTDNGRIDARLTPLANGTIAASSSNGAVTIAVPEDVSIGYDAQASTQNGDAIVCLSGVEAEGDSLNLRTPGFEERGIQVSIRASSQNGDVTISSCQGA